jgi:hypothetical protein
MKLRHLFLAGVVLAGGLAALTASAYVVTIEPDVHASLPSQGTPARICTLDRHSMTPVADATVVPDGANCHKPRTPFYPLTALVIEESIGVGDRVYLVTGENGTRTHEGRFAVTKERLGHS